MGRMRTGWGFHLVLLALLSTAHCRTPRRDRPLRGLEVESAGRGIESTGKDAHKVRG